MSGMTDMITGAGAKKARKQAAQASLLAEKRANDSLKAQEAIQARAAAAENKRSDILAQQQAGLMRVGQLRRRGGSPLAFLMAAGQSLKSTLGR